MTWLAALLVGCPKPEPVAPPAPVPVPLAERRDVVETLHGVEVHDPYRWLEQADAPDVVAWTDARKAEFHTATEALPVRQALYDRLQKLLRYDDQTVREPCLLGERSTFWTKRADQDKWVLHLATGPDDPGKVVLDPNTWDKVETLGGFYPSPDCKVAVYGKARAGDENPVLTVIDLDTLAPGPDTFRGWKQGAVDWKNDDSGFWYASKPLASEKPDGGEFYYHRVWWHTRGTTADQDQLVLADDANKELFHGVSLSEDGRWLLRFRSLFNENAVELVDLQAKVKKGEAPPVVPVAPLDAEHQAMVLDDKLVVVTDWEAPRRRVMIADLAKPGRDQWKELIPQAEDTLLYVAPVGGRLYAVYQHDVATKIRVYGLDGVAQGELPLPTLGSAGVSGYWTRPEVEVSFESFGQPTTIYAYDPAASAAENHGLTVLKESAIPVDRALLDQIVVDQVWYHSKDGTAVPMFVVHLKGATGPLPTLLTGYGGFDISMDPSFSVSYTLWLERGGVVAIPNLRGGGEFGKDWHEAGMLGHKQNVFDDFLAAADWLVAEGWTTPEHLAISGGSNGGLLVSAAVTQRPELFRAVLCAVPLTDMVRYHRFGLANIWSEEYGNAEDPAAFEWLRAYSPYHAVKEGTDYPAILVIGSANDARTDPAHARKFMAAVQWADADHGAEEPILLEVQGDSGHGGGVTIDTRADQISRSQGFLMHQVGLDAPVGTAAGGAATPVPMAAPAPPTVR
ncbi:MAG: prolyl oligopeptidase family serine peptidase [Myxococcota bacterium]